ncbi:MAG: DNA-3-methyladenine glycosylase [Prochlorothrix sp.]
MGIASPTFPPQTPIDPIWLDRPVTAVAPDLIGCHLVRQWPDGRILRSCIVETEAYGPGDPACHGYRRRTARNGSMFEGAGRAYVYQIYGLYHCLNIVTGQAGVASAVLIRAVMLEREPEDWPDRRPPRKSKPDPLHRLGAGPGKLCQVLAIDRRLDGTQLEPGQALHLERRSPEFEAGLGTGSIALVQTTRIGLSQGQDLPWRWYWAGAQSVSKIDRRA